jgi:phosphotriesterase-related protein
MMIMRSIFTVLILALMAVSCQSKTDKSEVAIMTVTGPISVSDMGLTLEHEHVLVDFIGAEKVKQPQYPMLQALDSLLPYFIELEAMGVNTLIECTPNYIGRDVQLLKAISEKSKLNIITNTGYYAATNKKFLPAHTYTESAQQLAARWVDEWKNGLDGTGIKPGFIKLGVGKDHLDSLEQKIVTAGALTHLETGLKIAIHTGSAAGANDEIDILLHEGVRPQALIVVHSQNSSSEEQVALARRGAWVSLDGVNDKPTTIEKYLVFLSRLKQEKLLDRVLISQDAFWSVVQHENNKIGFEKHGSPYSAMFEVLIPELKKQGFSQQEIDQLLITNPARAYKIEILRIDS